MNEIEQMFYDAFLDIDTEDNIKSQVPVGIYVVDFVIELRYIRVAIEIDGHEAHKTKEQRYRDYVRERFLMNMGHIVVRFTGSEVFVNSRKCAREALHIAEILNEFITSAIELGRETERAKIRGKK